MKEKNKIKKEEEEWKIGDQENIDKREENKGKKQ